MAISTIITSGSVTPCIENDRLIQNLVIYLKSMMFHPVLQPTIEANIIPYFEKLLLPNIMMQ